MHSVGQSLRKGGGGVEEREGVRVRRRDERKKNLARARTHANVCTEIEWHRKIFVLLKVSLASANAQTHI